MGSGLVLAVSDPTAFAVAVAVARGVPTTAETLRIAVDGVDIPPRVVDDDHGGRLHVFEATPGTLRIDYAATVAGRAAPAPVTPLDETRYGRPSRYVQSDVLTGFARETFPGLEGRALVTRVEAWVHDRLEYRPEDSSPTGGAVETLDAGGGVCRDFAHLTAGLLRALDVPARVVSVYAPGLQPRDFHAVVEALVDGRWIVIDATRLAPRAHLVRMATGRDAADVAFVTNTLADVELLEIDVRATSDTLGETWSDDPEEIVELG